MHGQMVISFQSILGRCFGSSRSWAHSAVEVERGIGLLLADRRQDMDAAVFDLDRDGLRLALGIANLDLMQPADLIHVDLRGDRVLGITRQAIDASPHQGMGAEFMGRAEKLLDVALMHRAGSQNSAIHWRSFPTSGSSPSPRWAPALD